MRKAPRRIRLGHIAYSNCVPVHARLLGPEPDDAIEIVHGTPAELNHALAESRVDVAPASSIEFARHPDRYRILPDLSIASRGAVRTIVLASRVPWSELGGARVALPTASATSVVLLRALLEIRHRVEPRYEWFRQESQDPFRAGADAALFIGDVAAAAHRVGHAHTYDLGTAWTEWTRLPFVFALWQTALGPERADDLRVLRDRLTASRDWALGRLDALAARHAADLRWDAPELAAYWRSLDFGLDPSLRRGLEAFYRFAAEIGDIPRAPALRFTE